VTIGTKAEIPADALCAEQGCFHRYDGHEPVPFDASQMRCTHCVTLREKGVDYAAAPFHVFTVARLAGGALSPTQEREAYLKAMRGE
jgi:hypothetical protein